VSLLAVPRRARLFVAKVTVCAVISALAAVLVAVPFPHAAAGTAYPAMVTAYFLLALVGFGFAVIARTVVTPLAVLSAVALLAAPMFRGVVPDLVTYLPHDAALSLAGLPGGPEALGRAGGLLVLLSWAAACVAVAGLVFVRRDA
jgi:ABC-2 type transport system permease protein